MLHSSDLFLGNVDNELGAELSFAFSFPFRMGYVVVFQYCFVFLEEPISCKLPFLRSTLIH